MEKAKYFLNLLGSIIIGFLIFGAIIHYEKKGNWIKKLKIMVGIEEKVFVFEGHAKRSTPTDVLNPYKMTADYSLQFTIIEEKVHFILTLTNRKYTDRNEWIGKVGFSDSSKCMDEQGNILFDFKDVTKTEESESVHKGILNGISAKILRRISSVDIVLKVYDLKNPKLKNPPSKVIDFIVPTPDDNILKSPAGEIHEANQERLK